MIDITKEEVLPLTQAVGWVPRPNGGRLSVSTLYRWTNVGVQGVRLEFIMVGEGRYTSREALQRFFAAVTRAKQGEIAQPDGGRTYAERERAMKQAEARLAAAGRIRNEPRRDGPARLGVRVGRDVNQDTDILTRWKKLSRNDNHLGQRLRK